MRAHVEAQINLVAQGKAARAAVVAHCLDQFRAKFAFFVRRIGRMDALFEATFSPLASSGEGPGGSAGGGRVGTGAQPLVFCAARGEGRVEWLQRSAAHTADARNQPSSNANQNTNTKQNQAGPSPSAAAAAAT